MSGAYAEIARVLRVARRRQVWVVLLAAVGLGAALALLCLLLGAAALGLGARAWVRAASLAGAALGVAGSVAWAARALLRTAWSDEAAARTVAGGERALRSDLVSSVELARERGAIQASGRFSVALVDAHLAGTAARARALDLSRTIPSTLARRGAVALAAVLAVHGVAWLVLGASLGKGYGRLLAAAGHGLPAAVVDPITGDIELTFRYPAYMRRDPKTLSGTGGEIRAPKGTEVELHTRADRKVDAAELEVDLTADPGAAAAASAAPTPPASPPRLPRRAAREPARRRGARPPPRPAAPAASPSPSRTAATSPAASSSRRAGATGSASSTARAGSSSPDPPSPSPSSPTPSPRSASPRRSASSRWTRARPSGWTGRRRTTSGSRR